MPKSLKRQPVSEKAKETKKAILQATIHIELREGIEKLNTNAIAERAGVSIGSLYQYYSNKDEILDELLNDIIERRQSRIKSALDMKILTDDISVTVRKVIDAVFDTESKDEAQVEGLLFSLLLQKSADRRIIAKAEAMESIMYPVIKTLITLKNPKILKRDLDTVVFVLIQSMRGIFLASGLSFGKKINKQLLKHEVTHMIVSYLESQVAL